MVVMQGTPWLTAEARIRPSSVLAPLPLGVLTIRAIRPLARWSRRFGRPSAILRTGVDGDPVRGQRGGGAGGPHQVVAHRGEPGGDRDDRLAVPGGDADEDRARLGQSAARGHLALGEGGGERRVDPHHLAGRPHLRAEHDVHAGELGEREDALLHRDVRRLDLGRDPLLVQRLWPTITRAATFARFRPVALETNGTVREARGLTSRT